MADDKSIQDPVVKALAEHICSFQFQRSFEEFFLKHALSFTDEQEHQLDYMTIYLEFQQLFNRQMEDFLTAQGISEDEFSRICQKAIKQDKRADNFLEIVIASMDYDAFFSLMKAMRGRASAERKSKLGHGDDDEDDKDSDAKGTSREAKHSDEKNDDDEKSEDKDSK
ncbi:hypothetical protein Poli38472_013419 [Pythium oligandrum]|uniref:Cilia- and flagella-associated protein 36 n=1 Tax=Pythium oligandrum TaxID=41045 RepID=A0A8K1FC55_PYTOL|nr:hypothetical protein Poli38472_013419 [Pythium oligandrum]|eukprot:TMW57945.1 hypothetical protein Poli38472_013419 [Pythium oligandrum]